MRFLTVLLVMAVAGCASPNGALSPDQVKAWAADKSANALCATFTGMWGQTRVVAVNLDKGTVPAGGVTMSPDCTTSITVLPKEPAPVVVAPTPKPP